VCLLSGAKSGGRRWRNQKKKKEPRQRKTMKEKDYLKMNEFRK